MFHFIKTFFKLTNTEIKGALMLLFFILLVFIAPRVYFYFQKPKPIDDTEFIAWAVQQNTLDSLAKAKKNYKNENQENSFFKFDPNTVSYDEMLRLGFEAKTASILLKFRSKGAKFRNKKDLMKVYGFEEELHSKLEDYIIYPEVKKKTYANNKKEIAEIQYFVFDPNTVSKAEMKQLGIPSKTASILEKFRNKGAKFYNKKDVLKVYGFTEALYATLENHILFPDKPDDEIQKLKENSLSKEAIPTLYIVDVNKADTADFIKLKGIGAFYAKTIIEYRTKLGGFYDIQQLKEAYGISPELFESLEMSLVLQNPNFRTININTATFKDLIRHPYIDKALTIEILNLRDDIGGFLKVEDLISYNVLSEKELERLGFYLAVE